MARRAMGARGNITRMLLPARGEKTKKTGPTDVSPEIYRLSE
jgi:hypothetical protein